MATIKTEWVNLTSELRTRTRRQWKVKLDAWKVTFYYWSLTTKSSELVVNGLPLSLFAHDATTESGPAGNGPLVIELGGAHYKGRPIQMDDEITFLSVDSTEDIGALLMIKQYFVEDRPGPDRMLGDTDPNIPPAKIRRPTSGRPPASPARPTRPTITDRPLVARVPNRDTFSR